MTKPAKRFVVVFGFLAIVLALAFFSNRLRESEKSVIHLEVESGGLTVQIVDLRPTWDDGGYLAFIAENSLGFESEHKLIGSLLERPGRVELVSYANLGLETVVLDGLKAKPLVILEPAKGRMAPATVGKDAVADHENWLHETYGRLEREIGSSPCLATYSATANTATCS